jgi:hypothetical protein
MRVCHMYRARPVLSSDDKMHVQHSAGWSALSSIHCSLVGTRLFTSLSYSLELTAGTKPAIVYGEFMSVGIARRKWMPIPA